MKIGKAFSSHSDITVHDIDISNSKQEKSSLQGRMSFHTLDTAVPQINALFCYSPPFFLWVQGNLGLGPYLITDPDNVRGQVMERKRSDSDIFYSGPIYNNITAQRHNDTTEQYVRRGNVLCNNTTRLLRRTGVLGSLLFILYTADLSIVVATHESTRLMSSTTLDTGLSLKYLADNSPQTVQPSLQVCVRIKELTQVWMIDHSLLLSCVHGTTHLSACM